MTAAVDPTEKVRPPAVTADGEEEAPDGASTVVLAKPTPLGPKLTVLSPITFVVGEAFFPTEYVVPLMTATFGATTNVRPPAVTAEGDGEATPSAGTVALSKPTPLGPKLTVLSPITFAVGEASFPIEYVVPLMTATFGATENASPPAVTADKVATAEAEGMSMVVPAAMT